MLNDLKDIEGSVLYAPLYMMLERFFVLLT